MIFTSLSAMECPYRYPPAIQTALDWITEHDLANLEAGTYELQGQDLYINLQDITTKPVGDCFPERHNDYLDIQYVVSGVERMGFAPYSGCETVVVAPEGKDIVIYEDLRWESFVDVPSGCFCIFFPSDIHRPGCAAGEPGSVRKAVIKLRRSLLIQ